MNRPNNDDVSNEYKNVIWNEGKCLQEVNSATLQRLFELWKKSTSNEARKGEPFENFVEVNELSDVVDRLNQTKLVICNTGARQCSCIKMLCRIHYREHILNGEHNRFFKDREKSKPDDKPPTEGTSPEEKKRVSPIGVA